MKAAGCYIVFFLFLHFFSYSQKLDTLLNRYSHSTGVHVGTWFPQGANKVIGNPSVIGISVRLKKKRHSLEVMADFCGLGTKTADTLKFIKDNLVISQTLFRAGQYIISYGLDVIRAKQFFADMDAGVGYGAAIYYPGEGKKGFGKGSPLGLLGASITWQASRKFYLRLRADYTFCNYHPPAAITDLRGNYISARLIFGFCK